MCRSKHNGEKIMKHLIIIFSGIVIIFISFYGLNRRSEKIEDYSQKQIEQEIPIPIPNNIKFPEKLIVTFNNSTVASDQTWDKADVSTNSIAILKDIIIFTKDESFGSLVFYNSIIFKDIISISFTFKRKGNIIITTSGINFTNAKSTYIIQINLVSKKVTWIEIVDFNISGRQLVRTRFGQIQ
jgi:hypothetical protein